MMNRRDALVSLTAFFELATARANADAAQGAQPSAPRPAVLKQDLPNVSLDGWEVTVSNVDYAPGRVGAPHKHAGFVLAYVLEGSVVAKVTVDGKGEERTYKTGQMFYEPIGATHEVSKNASQTEPAKLLAMIFAKKGSVLTTPVQRSGGDGGE